MQKNIKDDYRTRCCLKKYLNKKVHCRGTFSGCVRYLGTHYHPKIMILVTNVRINQLSYEHIWVPIEDDFRDLKLGAGSIIEFDTVIHEYKGKELEDKYSGKGITDLIVIHKEEFVEKAIFVKIGSLRFHTVYLRKNGRSEETTLQHFIKDFNIETSGKITRLLKEIELRYVKNYKETIVFDVYLNGEKLNGAVAFFNPYSERKGFRINNKYYLSTKIAMSSWELCSLFFQKQTLVKKDGV